MEKFLIKNANFSGIDTDVETVLNLPVAGIYAGLMLRFLDSSGDEVAVATLKTEIDNITVRINGQEIIDHVGIEHLFALEQFYMSCDGFTNQAGVLGIPFYPMEYIEEAPRVPFYIGMGDVTTFQIAITCATITTVSAIECYSLIGNNPSSAGKSKGLGSHIRLKQMGVNFSGTGDNEITSLPINPSMGYRALHLYHTSGVMQKATVKINQVNVRDNTPREVIQYDNIAKRRQNQTSYESICFNLDNQLGSFRPMKDVSDFRITPYWSSAVSGANYTMIREEIHNLVSK